MSDASISGNQLSAYSSYTYNFKLYALDPETHSHVSKQNVDFESIHNFNSANMKKAIIIESGVTNMSIDDLSITSLPTSTDATILNKLSFKVTQPKGFSFIESIVAAGSICGWKSFLASPFLILEIQFKGWVDDTYSASVPKSLRTVSIPIQISRVNTELDGGGTRYSVDAVVLFDWTRQIYSDTMAAFSVPNCNTFSDFLTKFEDTLNEETSKDRTQNDIYKTLHRFEVDDELANLKLNSVSNEKNLLYNIPAKSESGDVQGASFTIPNQMSIPKILESVLTASEEMQGKLKIDDREALFGHMFQIDPTIQIKDFNYAMGEYTYDVIWKVRLVPTQLIRNINTSNFTSDTKTANRAFDYINNRKFCKFSKVYYHYFTGVNSEVLSADIDMSNLYSNKLARYNSLFSTEANSGGVIKGNTTSTDEVKKNLQSAQNDSLPERDRKSNSSEKRVFYVDSIDSGEIEKLKNHRLLYRFARDTQSSTPQKTGTDAAETKSQDVADELRNIRNQLQLSAMNLTLEIKGDPYWLTPMHGNYENKSVERLSSIQPNVIGFMTGFPNEVQERGVRNDYMFSGIYLVKTVISSFNNGKFTQKLECARYHHIDSGTFQKKHYSRGNS